MKKEQFIELIDEAAKLELNENESFWRIMGHVIATMKTKNLSLDANQFEDLTTIIIYETWTK